MASQATHVLLLDVRKIRKQLEENPIKEDLVPAVTSMEVGNFVAQAHPAIDKGLKWAIVKAGGKLRERETHSLHSLLQRLRDLGAASNGMVAYLEDAFASVRRFYKVDVSRPGLQHLATLDKYFGAVGEDEVYNAGRYGVLDSISENAFSSGEFHPKLAKVWDCMHIEIIRALERLLSRDGLPEPSYQGDTIATRVERAFDSAINEGLNDYLAKSPSGTGDGTDIMDSLEAWKRGSPSVVAAMEQALRSVVIDDERVQEVLQRTFAVLAKSPDLAVRYRLNTFRYMGKGSQPPIPGVQLKDSLVPVNGNDEFLQVISPGEQTLGFIKRKLDGSWHLDSFDGYYLNAWHRDDAAWCSIRMKVSYTPFVVNGDSRSYLLLEGTSTYEVLGIFESDLVQNGFPNNACTISFWDDTHGLMSGDRVALKLMRRNQMSLADYRRSDLGDGAGWVITGDVSEMTGSKVTLADVRAGFTGEALEEFLAQYVPDF